MPAAQVPRTVGQQSPTAREGRSLAAGYRENWSPGDALTSAGALRRLRPPRGWTSRGRRDRAFDTEVARFGHATGTSSCQGPEVPCARRLWRFSAVWLVSVFCRGSSGPATRCLSWTEAMADSREAGAEASLVGAPVGGGLSLLPQAESEEPSAQVSASRGGTCGSS